MSIVASHSTHKKIGDKNPHVTLTQLTEFSENENEHLDLVDGLEKTNMLDRCSEIQFRNRSANIIIISCYIEKKRIPVHFSSSVYCSLLVLYNSLLLCPESGQQYKYIRF